MTDDSALPPEFEELVGQVHDFVYRQAHPRLSAQQVRRQGNRRRRTRHGATALGSAALAAASVFTAALLVRGHGPAIVTHPATGHPVPSPTALTLRPKPTPVPSTAVDRPGIDGQPSPSTTSSPSPLNHG